MDELRAVVVHVREALLAEEVPEEPVPPADRQGTDHLAGRRLRPRVEISCLPLQWCVSVGVDGIQPPLQALPAFPILHRKFEELRYRLVLLVFLEGDPVFVSDDAEIGGIDDQRPFEPGEKRDPDDRHLGDPIEGLHAEILFPGHSLRESFLLPPCGWCRPRRGSSPSREAGRSAERGSVRTNLSRAAAVSSRLRLFILVPLVLRIRPSATSAGRYNWLARYFPSAMILMTCSRDVSFFSTFSMTFPSSMMTKRSAMG